MVESRKWSQVVPSLAATVGAFGCGNMIAWPSVAQPHVECAEGSEGCDLALTSSQYSNVASLAFIGCTLVGPVAAVMVSWMGKKWTMVSLSLPFLLGWVLIMLASGEWMLDLGRILTGFSGGAFALLAPAYSSETVEQSIKGALGSLQQLMVCFGLFFVNVLGKFVSWQTLSGLCLIPPVVLGVTLAFMPRSPVFLVSKGMLEEAKKSLLFLRGPNFDVSAEIEVIQKSLAESEAIGSISLITLVTKGVYLKPFLIALVIMFLQQFSGINVIVSYAVTIFKDAGTSVDPFICNILVAVTQICFTAVSMLLVDRFGRRVLAVASELLMGCCLFAVGAYFYLKSQVKSHHLDNTDGAELYATDETLEAIAIMPLVALLLFIAGFSIGMGPLPWLLNSELFSKEAKTLAAPICGSFNWFCSFLVVRFYPDIAEALDVHYAYFFFGTVCLLGAVFVLLVVPETKGRTDEDMKAYFMGHKDKEDKPV